MSKAIGYFKVDNMVKRLCFKHATALGGEFLTNTHKDECIVCRRENAVAQLIAKSNECLAMAETLQLPKPKKRAPGEPWATTDDRALREHFAEFVEGYANMVNRTPGAITSRLRKLI
jgi:hypothetical protein